MTSESLARYHERKQDHADGFQAGWHAALQRVSEGDSVTKLRDSVPDTAPAYRAERDRLAAKVELLDRQIAYLNGQVARQADEISKERHLRVQAEADRDRLAAEVERLWALLHSGAWHRHDDRTYLAIRMPDGADLSCRATREDAIRAALAEAPTPAREEGQ